MKPKPSTNHKPQSNGIIEWVHQVLGNALHTFELEEKDLDPVEPLSSFIAVTAFVIRNAYHITLESTPAQMV